MSKLICKPPAIDWFIPVSLLWIFLEGHIPGWSALTLVALDAMLPCTTPQGEYKQPSSSSETSLDWIYLADPA